ncbi:MAG: WD40/YVTN/BNR-like repeat-containing protein [Longimicrobiales bacterium]
MKRVAPGVSQRIMIRSATLSLLIVAALPAGACSTGGPVEPPDCVEEIDGACWSFLGLEDEWITALAETPMGLFAGTHKNGVFRHDPVAGRWQSLGLDHAIVWSILYVPTEPARLLVGMIPFSDETTEAAVFASEDRGETWIPWDGGLAESRGDRGWAYSLAVDPDDPRRLFMSYFDVMMRSDDGGETWNPVYNELSLIGGGAFHAIVVSGSQPDAVWAGGVTSVFTAVILRSEDGGDSWEFIDPTPRHENNVNALLEVPGESGSLLAGLGGVGDGVMRSTDSGRTWDYTLFTRGVVKDIITSDNTIYAAASENFRPPPSGDGAPVTDLGLYRSSDRGSTWDKIAKPAGLPGGYALDRDQAGAILIGTKGGVWRALIP